MPIPFQLENKDQILKNFVRVFLQVFFNNSTVHPVRASNANNLLYVKPYEDQAISVSNKVTSTKFAITPNFWKYSNKTFGKANFWCKFGQICMRFSICLCAISSAFSLQIVITVLSFTWNKTELKKKQKNKCLRIKADVKMYSFGLYKPDSS